MDKFTASNGCRFSGCTHEAHARGLCDGHYYQFRKGVPLAPLRAKRASSDDPTSYFWRRVDRSESCWTWTGALTDGYGVLSWDGRTRRAHRVAFEIEVGEIPTGMQVDHICRNRACVRPSHLRLATNKQNNENRGSHSASGFRGVRRARHGKRWVAYARHNRIEHRVPGSFETPEGAAAAASALRESLFTHSLDGARAWPVVS